MEDDKFYTSPPTSAAIEHKSLVIQKLPSGYRTSGKGGFSRPGYTNLPWNHIFAQCLAKVFYHGQERRAVRTSFSNHRSLPLTTYHIFAQPSFHLLACLFFILLWKCNPFVVLPASTI